MEHAGIDPTSLRHGDTGVSMGVTTLDHAFESAGLAPADVDGHLAPGLSHSAVSGRLSFFLGPHGPCMTVDTTCSSSPTATHLAHERAGGCARAEGRGVLVLKRLSDALRDGDTVHAVIRGSAVGQDGESAGLVAPNGAAQEQVMRSAPARCRPTPGDIQYVEAHRAARRSAADRRAARHARRRRGPGPDAGAGSWRSAGTPSAARWSPRWRAPAGRRRPRCRRGRPACRSGPASRAGAPCAPGFRRSRPRPRCAPRPAGPAVPTP
ncbi:polyketide synthase [Streptomyces sp. KHY 26]|uniref:beta-ketoacyl [acyl carrier protein] synthase domain-containing protein n=1 Tax=Streptomyces sp. KHY 26 TaxID=3097359 RepID=UPI00376EA456